MLMENTYASFWQKKCYIFLKFGRKSAKRFSNVLNFLHTSSHILHKTQRTQAILDGIKSLFPVVLLKRNNPFEVQERKI